MLDIFGSIGRILPGYVEGQRNAIKDNWQDLENYNNVQAGQLANAFTEATFGNNVDMMYDAAKRSRLGLGMDLGNFAMYLAGYGDMFNANLERARALPYLQQLDNIAKINLFGQYIADPRLQLGGVVAGGLGGFGGFGNVNNPPSVMR